MLLAAAAPDVRLLQSVRRFAAFVAVSIGLHSALLLAPDLDFGRSVGPTSAQPVLHATLTPADSARPDDASMSAPEPTDQSPAGAKAAPAAPGPSQEPGGSPLPLPDRWYKATELGSLAQPLTLPVMTYPRELTHLGAIRLRIRLFVDEYGVVRKLEFVDTDVHATFKTAARDAWENVRFEPARRDQLAVKSQKLLEIDFVP